MKPIQVMAKVKRSYKKECKPGKLCKPADWFSTIEECKICKKKI